MSNKLLVPQIRFKEFTNAWEQDTAKNLFIPYRVKNSSNMNLVSYSVTNKDGFVNQNEYFDDGGKAVFADKKNSLIVSINTFAYNPSRINVGSLALYKHSEMGLVSPIYEVFQINNNNNPDFFLLWFRSEAFKNIVSTNSNKSVRDTLNLSQFESESVNFPNFAEQSKISSLFTHLDSLITLHQRKLLSLKNLKSRLLDRMFCDEKSQFPSIRFKEFTNAWEQEKLGECSKFYNGLTSVSKSDFGVGKDLYIDYLNVFNNTFSQFSELKKFKNSSRQNYVQFKDVILTISSETPDEVAMSSVINWKNDYKNVAFNSFCILVRFNQLEKYDVNYIGYFFRSNSFRTQAMLMAQGISRFNINQTALKKTLFLFPPNIYEQQKIGNVLYYLDSLITLHQRG